MRLHRSIQRAAIVAAAIAAVLGLGMSSAYAVSWNDANRNGQIDQRDTGDAVRCVQNAVMFDGISVGGVDGQFGTNTRNGVLAYQARYNLSRDGQVGPQTGGRMATQVRLYQRTAHQTGSSSAPYDTWLAACVGKYFTNSGQSIFH